MSTQVTKPHKKNFRLPRVVTPLGYDLVIIPRLESRTFEGVVAIKVRAGEPVSSVALNAKDVAIHEAHMSDEGGTRLFGAVSIDSETELATVSFDGVAAAGEWKLYLRFSGNINDKLKGIYRSKWKNARGVEQSLIATQFCATDARRAFPCFDEPEFKAPLKLTLVVDRDLTALSGSDVDFVEPIADGQALNIYHGNGLVTALGPLFRKKRVTFRPTMSMSTYLYAFVVGKLQASEAVTANGVRLRMWSVPGKEHLTEFARSAAEFALPWFENYFGLSYPGDGKLDFIALPDHAYGAMENLGLVTFREPALLVDSKSASYAERKRVAATVIHEIAHMWFGDLVTMRWWNGIWLNEAFATFMQHLCLSQWQPTWKIWDEFALDRASASRIDSLSTTHAIESPVHHPDEASELFDVISYQKGCSVLYQIHQFIGADVFRAGIKAYLAKHAYGSTETHDLWNALEKATRKAGLSIPVRQVMDAWVLTAGHPIVTVSESAIEGCIKLSQQRFRLRPSQDPVTLLPVPIMLRVVGKDGRVEEKRVLLSGAEKTVYVGDNVDYVVANAGGSGFYRVTYAPELAAKLVADPMKNLSLVERFNLVNDSWYAVKSGASSSLEHLALVKKFASETEYPVWNIAIGSLKQLHGIADGAVRLHIAGVVAALVGPTAARLGWLAKPTDSIADTQVRELVLQALGTTGGDSSCLTEARGVFGKWKADKSAVDAETLSAAIAVLAFNGGASEYDEFSALAFGSGTPQEKDRFLGALASFRDKELLERTLNKVRQGEVRVGDAAGVIGRLMDNKLSAAITWQFLKEEFEALAARFPEPAMINVCRAVSRLDDDELEAEVREFLTSRKFTAGAMAIAQSLEEFGVNITLRQRESKTLATLVPATK